MSQENVETLRDGFEAFARGDVDDVLERLDPDVDWSPAIGPILGVETVRGREDLRRFLTRDLFDGFDSAIVDIYEARTGIKRPDIEKLMDAETFMGPTEAVKNGFADAVDALLEGR